MELSLSVKPGPLSLINRSPVCCRFSASRLPREFFGAGRPSLRPSVPPHSRKKCKELGFLFRVSSPSFVLKASLDSQSALIVVAVVTVSALTVVYLNYSRRNDHMSQQLSLALSQKIRSIVKWDIFGHFFRSSVTYTNASGPGTKSMVNGMIIDSHNHNHTMSDVQLNENDSVHPETILTSAFDYPHSNLLSSSIQGSLSSTEMEMLTSPSESFIQHNSNAQPLGSLVQATGAQLEGLQQHEVLNNSSRPLTYSKSTAAAAVSGSTNVQAEAHELGGAHNSLRFLLRDSAREELHTFYEASMTKLYSLPTPLQASGKECSAFPSLEKAPAPVGGELVTECHLSPAENFKGEGSIHGHRESSSLRMKDTRPREDISINKEKIDFHHIGSKNIIPYPAQKSEHNNRGHHPSRKFSAYNQFLKEGRLNECIEMLEELERKGLLDMDNVYHAGFFKVCKNQRSVKEAFRFTRLIPNPTLSTFNMLMSVCASAQDTDGAFQVVQLVREAGLVVDCKLYTNLISTCAKSGKVDTMFEVFHEMVNAGIEPNVHTYGALIDGCAKAGQVAKAFGAYGILRSKNVKPDRVVFNALITACGQSGAVDRAFDVLAEMRAETQPIDPDHITIGALMKACANAGQDDRAREVYKMIDEYNIKATPEVYTILINSCSQSGDLEFARSAYNDMIRKGISPDEMLISSLIDVAGHAGKLDSAFEVLEDAKNKGIPVGVIAYSSLMGACSNAKSWKKALDLYEDLKQMNLKPTVSMMNALITALCDANQLNKATEALLEMKLAGLCPNTITYSILLVASEKEDNLEVGLMLLSQAKKDGVAPNLVMCRCVIAMCLRRFQKSSALGEPVLSLNSGRPQLDSKWTSLALRIYREAILSGAAPTAEELSQVLGCLRVPHDGLQRKTLFENLLVATNRSKVSNLCSLVDGFGEYDPRAFSLLEEAASFGTIPILSLRESPIVIDVRDMHISMAEVYILTVIRGLKHRLAAGAKLPNITILLPIEKTKIQTLKGQKTVNLAGRITQAVAALLRRLRLPYQGNASYGKVRIFGVVLKKWLQPKLDSPFNGKPTSMHSFQTRLGKEISHQQRNIRIGNLSLD